MQRLASNATPQQRGDALTAGALPMLALAKRLSPYLSGTLRRSLTVSEPVHSRGESVVRYGTNVVYAAIQEFGGIIEIGKHTIVIKAQPYLLPSFVRGLPAAQRAMMASLKKMVSFD